MNEKPKYANPELSIEDRVRDLISRMTVDEKMSMLSSQGYHRIFVTKGIKRLHIPPLKMTDGPLGVARHSSWFKKNTRFPATVSLAASWNRDLVRRVGVAMGKEVRASGRHILLAPGINIQRTPLCGRTFEYYSEDPYLTSELAVEFVRGVQSQEIAACAKHYAANNQEIERKKISAEIDERTLHEIYLRSFRALAEKAQVWTFMTCYNKVNGTYGAANEYLITETLYRKWDFDGMVMTDWLSTGNIESTMDCVNAGLSLEMPFPNKYKVSSLRKAYRNGKLSDSTLDELVSRNLRTMFRTHALDPQESVPNGARNTKEHQNLARLAAEEGMVLLKNDGSLLPLDLEDIRSMALLGPNLKKEFGRFLYGGSSAVVPPYEVTPFEGIKQRCPDYIRLVKNPTEADVALLFMGLNHSRGQDSETYDRNSLDLPQKQVELILDTADKNENTIVVLIAGSPIAMDPWLSEVPVVLNAWYAGMESGNAIANILFGDINPSGRLPITYPMKLSDSPAHYSGEERNYPGDEQDRVFYDEGIFVGYRWFDKNGISPLFPFGYGLSYSDFEFESVEVENTNLSSVEDVTSLHVKVTNKGPRTGCETVQVYSHDIRTSVERPPRELVGFQKVFLEPGETKLIPVEVRVEDLRFYDITNKEWVIEPGDFRFDIGRSSRDILLNAGVTYSM